MGALVAAHCVAEKHLRRHKARRGLAYAALCAGLQEGLLHGGREWGWAGGAVQLVFDEVDISPDLDSGLGGGGGSVGFALEVDAEASSRLIPHEPALLPFWQEFVEVRLGVSGDGLASQRV
jgi:hypothetical protein